jgi:hypothetical protein
MTTETRKKIVPLVNSGTVGPLGVAHLPRLWLKLSLAAAGALPEGYDECGTGFDAMTLDALGLDRAKTMEYVRTAKPSYMTFEKWVVTNGKIDRATIALHNAAVRGYNHSEDLGRSMRAASRIEDETVKDAVMLNTIEDLDELHRELSTA